MGRLRSISRRLNHPERNLNDDLRVGSIAAWQNGIMMMREETMWIVRRFTLICCLTALFGTGIVALIQEGSSPAHSLRVENATPCVFVSPQRCGLNLGKR